ncbi:MAG: hypothetical protein U0169_27215 [Polyangiaceae bacterium]
MFGRVLAIAMNTYREAVRARILHGLIGLALAASIYSLVVATLSLHQETRVISDVGTSSVSLFAVVVAVVIGATSLHREIELKTVFPILTRRLRRHEYILGKYLGTLGTLGAFIALDGATILALVAIHAKALTGVLVAAGILGVVLAVALVVAGTSRVFVIVPWAVVTLVVMAVLAGGAPDDRRLILASLALTFGEVAIVSGVATLFASFSSPFLTAVFTLGIWLTGRSAETLGNLPGRVFGETLRLLCLAISRVVPNLQLYVPARPVLLGAVPEIPIWRFVGEATMHAFLYAGVLVLLSALVFRKRDFQ